MFGLSLQAKYDVRAPENGRSGALEAVGSRKIRNFARDRVLAAHFSLAKDAKIAKGEKPRITRLPAGGGKCTKREPGEVSNNVNKLFLPGEEENRPRKGLGRQKRAENGPKRPENGVFWHLEGHWSWKIRNFAPDRGLAAHVPMDLVYSSPCQPVTPHSTTVKPERMNGVTAGAVIAMGLLSARKANRARKTLWGAGEMSNVAI